MSDANGNAVGGPAAAQAVVTQPATVGAGPRGGAPVWPTPRALAAAAGAVLRDDENIQGNILAGFNKDHLVLLFLTFPSREVGQAWLTKLLPRIASTKSVARFNERFSAARHLAGSDPTDLAALWTNVSLSGEGMRLLAPDAVAAIETRADLDPGISLWLNGAADPAVLPRAGDTGTNAPASWVFGAADDHIHAVVCIAADAPADLALEIARHHEWAAELNYRVVFEQAGATLPGAAAGHEHFGFKDGISQPGVTNFDPPDPTNEEQVKGKPGTDLVAPGTFVLGYERDHEPAIPVPRWMWDGSFLVTRRLAQDVAGFWSNMEEEHAKLAGPIITDPDTGIPSPDALAARLVGRWRSGTPTDHRAVADQRSAQDPRLDNDFDFTGNGERPDDGAGVRTPHAAHIRKVYPRSGTPLVPEADSARRRILRRGIPYGPPFGPASGRGSGVDTERGLLFQCYQASIEEQFVFLQQVWVNNDSFAEPAAGKDAVIGLDSDVTLKGGGQTATSHFRQWVKTRGSVFSLTPSIPTLKLIAAGTALPESDPLVVPSPPAPVA